MAGFVTGSARFIHATAVIHEGRDCHVTSHVNDMDDRGLPRRHSQINAQVYENATPSFRQNRILLGGPGLRVAGRVNPSIVASMAVAGRVATPGRFGAVPVHGMVWGCGCRRWARAVWRRPTPLVRMAAARARRDPASTTSLRARVMLV